MFQDLKKGAPIYRLRWRFDYHNKPSVKGLWTSSACAAWSVNKDKLSRASIEAKDIRTAELKTLAACDGHDFVNFKWYGFVKSPLLGPEAYGQFRSTPIGLILQTRELDVLYLVDGSFGTKQRTIEDKAYNYAGFGK